MTEAGDGLGNGKPADSRDFLAGVPRWLVDGAYLRDGGGNITFSVEAEVLRALPACLDERTTTIQTYFSQYPPTDRDETSNVGRLIEDMHADVIAKALNESLAPNSTIIEAGCGAGRLCNFLGIVGRNVLGIDLSLPLLERAQALSRSTGRESNVFFAQMDIMSAPLARASFDAAICDCVLEYTGNPEQALYALVELVKSGGYVVVRCSKQSRFLVPTPPCHASIGVNTALRWLDNANVDFLRSVPAIRMGDNETFCYRRSLFESTPVGSRLDRLIVRIRALANGEDHGRCTIVGRKR